MGNVTNPTTLFKLNKYTKIRYGLLYNWYVTQGSGSSSIISSDMATAGWGVPTRYTFDDLRKYFESGSTYDNNTVGVTLKQKGLAFWTTPNTDADNTVKFNARGAGTRSYNAGAFAEKNERLWLHIKTDPGAAAAFLCYLWYDDKVFFTPTITYFIQKKTGVSIRLFREATVTEKAVLNDGDTCDPYIGNDGKIYRTVIIGDYVWLADNLAETKYRDGSSIPEVTGNAAWAALTTAAYCAYDNDYDNMLL